LWEISYKIYSHVLLMPFERGNLLSELEEVT
jgi:hypothetical protein